MVGTHTDVLAGEDFGTALADDDGTNIGNLAIAKFNAQILWV